jgi:hypothetical protein
MAFTKILVGASVSLAVMGAAGGEGLAREESAVIHRIPPLSSVRSAKIINILPALRPAIGFGEALKGARKATTAPTLEEAPLLRKAYEAPTLAEAPPPGTASGGDAVLCSMGRGRPDFAAPRKRLPRERVRRDASRCLPRGADNDGRGRRGTRPVPRLGEAASRLLVGL